MSMDFSVGAGAATPSDLIPNGQLAWAYITVRGLKSSASGGQYLDVELTLDEGQPYGRKKVWDMIGDPNWNGNGEAYRQMGLIAITRILEAGRGAGPNNLTGYKINQYSDLSGLKIAIKIKVEAGKDGHADKNRVAEYLTPNPASQSGNKGWQMLSAGQYNTAPAAAAPVAQSGFGGFGGAAPASPPAGAGFGGFASAAAPQPQPQSTGFGGSSTMGFQQPQPQGESGAAFAGAEHSQPGATGGTGFASTTPATGASPSNPGATPGWLAQAGTQ